MHFQFLYFAVAEPPGGEQQGQETLQIQQGTGQVVYPAHAQYVDDSDPPIYAASNGQMYGLVHFPTLSYQSECVLYPPS